MARMRIVGIDPGKDGGIALAEVRPGGIVKLFAFDMPVIEMAKAKGKGKKRIYNGQAMRALLLESAPTLVVVEDTNPMPKQSIVTTWSQARGIALWEGLLIGLGMRYTTVTPQTWKRALMPGKARDKAATAQLMTQLYPEVASLIYTARGRLIDGRADALALAHYGIGIARVGGRDEQDALQPEAAAHAVA